MPWRVEYTVEFEAWWETLTAEEQDAVRYRVELLIDQGPDLGRPHVDHIKQSRHTNMKELRSQYAGRPLRTFFAFDPRRTAILLIGGEKTGKRRFYEEMIALADDLYSQHLRELTDEGAI